MNTERVMEELLFSFLVSIIYNREVDVMKFQTGLQEILCFATERSGFRG